MDLVTLLHDYGWAAVALVVVVDRVFPFLAKGIFPQLQKAQLAKIEAEKEEREFRHTLELRQVAAFDKLVETCLEIKNFMVSVDNRLETIEGKIGLPAQKRSKTRKSRVSRKAGLP